MSFLTDVGGKLVQSFLSLDDLVFGQGFVRDGVAGLAETGRSAMGAVAVSSNVAARAAQFAVQTGAKTARVTAAAVEGLVPGAGAAEDFAARVDRRATADGEQAALLASYSLELVGGAASRARNPLTGEPWLEKQAPRGYGWGDLAADTAIGPLGKLAVLPLTLSLDAFETFSHSAAGKLTRTGVLRALHALLDVLPGGGKSAKVDLAELRELLAASAGSSAGSALRDTMALAEALVRLSFGDVRGLRTTIAEGLDDMRQLMAGEKQGEVIPGVPVSDLLRRKARNVVDHAPVKFLAALEPTKDGRPPRLGAMLSALVADAANVRVFVLEYPQALALLATNLGALWSAGTLDAADVEAWVRDDGTWKGDDKKTRPWSATLLERTLGKAEVVAGADPESGPFPRAAIWVAQDTVLGYSSAVLGRAKGLARIERLFGRKVRERVEADPSLDAAVMEAERGEKRDARLRAVVAGLAASELSHRWKRADEQLDSLRVFETTIYNQSPEKITERIAVLDAFSSFAGQALALEPAAEEAGDATSARLAALARFEAWAGV